MKYPVIFAGMLCMSTDTSQLAKRPVFIILAVLLTAATLAACGGETPEEDTSSTATPVSQMRGTQDIGAASEPPGPGSVSKSPGEFVSVSAGPVHICGVKADGSVVCWGTNNSGQATPPEGEFASVSAGSWHSCGVKTDGSVSCWGSDSVGQAAPPQGAFASVSAGGQHTCGVRRDRSAACWGVDLDGRATPP